MEKETYLFAVTVKGCEKKDLRLAANRRKQKMTANISERTKDRMLALHKVVNANNPKGGQAAVDEIVERAIQVYHGMVKEGVRV